MMRMMSERSDGKHKGEGETHAAQHRPSAFFLTFRTWRFKFPPAAAAAAKQQAERLTKREESSEVHESEATRLFLGFWVVSRPISRRPTTAVGHLFFLVPRLPTAYTYISAITPGSKILMSQCLWHQIWHLHLTLCWTVSTSESGAAR